MAAPTAVPKSRAASRLEKKKPSPRTAARRRALILLRNSIEIARRMRANRMNMNGDVEAGEDGWHRIRGRPRTWRRRR